MDDSVERLRLKIDPEPTRLRELRTRIAKWLGGAGIAGDVRDAVVLAAHEVAASLIHRADRGVEVEGTIEGRVIRLVIHGRSSLDDPDGDEVGQRFSFVKALMSDVGLESRADGTSVRLEKWL